MLKNLFLLLLSLLFLQDVKAQKQDTISFYVKNEGQLVTDRNNADYIILSITPVDNSPGNIIKEYYPNGNSKLIGTGYINSNGYVAKLKFIGPYIEFYPNGHKKSMGYYKDGNLFGLLRNYYPNGKLSDMQIDTGGKLARRLIECRDTAGNILAENGKGKWITYDYSFKAIVTEGNIVDSLKEGEWDSFIGNKIISRSNYSKGKFVSGIYYGSNGKPYPFNDSEIEPRFSTKPDGLDNFLSLNIKYPLVDRDNNIEGKVILKFIVERDGRISNLKVLSAPDETLSDEAVRVIKLMPPWIPALRDGMPVRAEYIVPVNFSLGGKYTW
jgi:TonB family protein